MGEPQTILLIDDEADFRHVMERRLAAEGFRVLCAEDGLRGLELLRREQVDCILLDIMMPRMDGFTFLKTIQEEGRALPVPPIIVLTAFGRTITDEQRHLMGTIPVVNKPFDYPELLALIRKRIHGAQEGKR